MSTRRTLSLCVFLVIFLVPIFGQDVLELCQGTKVEFISGEKAQLLVTQNDEYVRALSEFDCKARTLNNDGSTKEEYLSLLASQITTWEESEKEDIKKSVEMFRDTMNALKLNLPKVIYLIKVENGVYEGLAFTRMNFIVFTQSMLEYYGLVDHVFPHEIFHVYSRYNRDISHKLYQLAKYEERGPLKLPGDIAYRRITNPDYVADTYCIDVTCKYGEYKGQTLTVFPVVLAPSKNLKPFWSFVDYYSRGFGLLVAEKKDHYYVPKLKDGKEIMIPVSYTNMHSLARSNSRYAHGPEEIMAENFYQLLHVMKNKNYDVRHQDVLDEMKEVILQGAKR